MKLCHHKSISSLTKGQQQKEDISKYASYEYVRKGVHRFYEYGKEVNRYHVWFQEEGKDKHLSCAHDKFGWLVFGLDYGSARKEAARLKAEGKKAWLERINPKIQKGEKR